MGRRKIEIQPITHERNRSVTFLKRKNGLFKKAYELGVLCSVDVAVIIFEERAGHHVKMYQYCSGNIDDIVQRHARFDGEKDIRTPNDFSSNSGIKLDDAAEGDDDDADEDELEPPPARASTSIKKVGDIRPRIEPVTKFRPSVGNGSEMDMDYLAHRPLTTPNPPTSMTSGHSSIPISGERHHSPSRMSSGNEMQVASGPNKKLRVTSSMDGGRSSHGETSPTLSDYGYHPGPTPHGYRGLPPNEQYASFFPISAPQSFPPGLPFDYPPSRGHYRTMNYPSTRSMPPYIQHADQHFTRPAHHQYQHHHPAYPAYPPMMAPQQHQGDIFPFLDGDPRQQQQQHTGQGFGPIDWPVHAPGQDGTPARNHGDADEVSWLDFLSGSAPNQPSVPIQASSSSLPATAATRDNMSWERDWPSGSHAAVASRPSSRLSSTTSDVAAHNVNPHKRSRVESDTSGGGGHANEQGRDVEMKSGGVNAKKTGNVGGGQTIVENSSDKPGS